jgi:hypothetical protein
MRLLNYTTKIDPVQTISEIQKMLSNYGVSAMMTEYDGPQVSAVSFRMNIENRQMGFKLPCNWKGVLEILKRPEYNRIALKDKEEQAVRVAWRIIRDWTEAQLALVEVNMVTIPQVFLPYAIMRNGQTLAEHVSENPGFLLGDGGGNG